MSYLSKEAELLNRKNYDPNFRIELPESEMKKSEAIMDKDIVINLVTQIERLISEGWPPNEAFYSTMDSYSRREGKNIGYAVESKVLSFLYKKGYEIEEDFTKQTDVITLKEDFRIPGTDIILEEGDRIRVLEAEGFVKFVEDEASDIINLFKKYNDRQIEKKWKDRVASASSKVKPSTGKTWSSQIEKGGFNWQVSYAKVASDVLGNKNIIHKNSAEGMVKLSFNKEFSYMSQQSFENFERDLSGVVKLYKFRDPFRGGISYWNS